MEPLPQPSPVLDAALDGVLPAGARPAAPAAAPRMLRPRLRRWVHVLSAYFTAQVLTQILGLLAGLLLVRTMPLGEFALYTLALSVVTFFTFVSDLGSTTSLLYFFHRTAQQQPEEFPLYLAAVRSLRRLAFMAGAVVVAVVLPRAALAKGFGGTEIALATAGVLLCVWFQIGASLSVLALRLADRYGDSYRAEIAGGGVRLAAAAAMIFASRLYGWLAVAGNAAAIAVVGLLARPHMSPPPARVDLAPYRRRVLRYLVPTLPSALYFSIQGPLVVWLSATFGVARNIAEVGALSRLGMLIGLFSNLGGIVFLPRLSRIADDRLYRERCLQFGGLLLAAALSVWLAAAAFPRAFLALLGPRYGGLDSELLLVAASAGLTLIGGYLVSVNLARSWTRWQGLAVLILAATQTALVKALPLATTRGVLTFNLLSAAVGLTLQLVISVLGFTRPSVVHWE
jgi:O-antigen/teichoic acid export membrane protein